ncbi:hypothetical protein EMCRGX_G004784 [Ephydatia muelleri]
MTPVLLLQTAHKEQLTLKMQPIDDVCAHLLYYCMCYYLGETLEQTLRDTVVHTFNFDKKRRNSGSSDLLLVSVLSLLLHNLESS